MSDTLSKIPFVQAIVKDLAEKVIEFCLLYSEYSLCLIQANFKILAYDTAI
jgi:hypothetical protein